MRNYLDLLSKIIDKGVPHVDRTGVGRISLYGEMLKFDLSDNKFPLVTTRKIFTKAIIKEMLWFIKGCTDITELTKDGVNIWNQWALTKEKSLEINQSLKVKDKLSFGKGDHFFNTDVQFEEQLINTIGPMYGHVWRNSLTGIDQLSKLIDGLKNKPYSSRHVVTAWIPELIPDEKYSPQENIVRGYGALAPCHMLFQCFVCQPKDAKKPQLSMVLYIRSSDGPVGQPYNITQYALLLRMLAQVCGYDAGELTVMLGDVHIYQSQLELAKIQVQRQPRELPTLHLNPDITDLYDFTYEDITIKGYDPDEAIKYPVAV